MTDAKPRRLDVNKIDTTNLEGFMQDVVAILGALQFVVWDDDDDKRFGPIRHLYMNEETEDDCGCPDGAEDKCVSVICPRKAKH